MELTKNNISTLSVFIYMIISPLFIKYGISVDDGVFTSIITGISGLIIALWSSMHPNTMKVLGNDTERNC